eukprot:6287935-Prymnesium_polylepis.1
MSARRSGPARSDARADQGGWRGPAQALTRDSGGWRSGSIHQIPGVNFITARGERDAEKRRVRSLHGKYVSTVSGPGADTD